MRRNRYILLLVVVGAQLVVLSLGLRRPWTDLTNLAATPLLAGLLGLITGKRRTVWTMLVLGTSASALNLVLPWGQVPLTLDLVKVALWCLAPAYLALRVFVAIYDTPKVGHAELAGAVTVYLLLALVFADIYEALYLSSHHHIQFGANFAAGGVGFREILYFSFVTLSTLGYGDVAPASTVTRLLVVAESITGLMYMAILVARFVSLHSAGRLIPRGDD